MERPDFKLWQHMQDVPPLGLLTALAAVIDLLFSRIALRALGDSLSQETLLTLNRIADLPRNLVGIGAIVAILASLMPIISLRGPAALMRRLGLAGFSGAFLPMMLVATVFPPEQTNKLFVFASVIAANMLSIMIGLAAVGRAAPRGVRLGVLLCCVTAVLSFAAFVIGILPVLRRLSWVAQTGHALYWMAEVSYFAIPLFVGLTTLRTAFTEKRFLGLLVGAFIAVAGASFFVLGIGDEESFRPIVYGAFGVKVFLQQNTEWYAVPFAIYLWVSAVGLLSRDPAMRQVGTGVLLALCSGFVPTSPARLLMWVLSVALISRASMVLGERLIAQRSFELSVPPSAQESQTPTVP